MFPFYFGPASRRLFGAFHKGTPGRAQGLAVLLCNPFGQEAIRTQRLYRVLAMRLAQGGIHTLRFDYFGTGDSAGDDAESNLEGWCDDILLAHRELVRLGGCGSVTWMGARLGATAALIAAQTATPNASRIVAWDPVVDGSGYSELLRVKHVETLEASFSISAPEWRDRLRNDTASFRDEAIGVAISPALRQQLARLSGNALTLQSVPSTVVIADPNDRPVRAWVREQQARRGAVEEVLLHHTLDWTSDDSLNAALVPAEAVRQLLDVIDR